MNKKRRGSEMFISALVMGIVAGILVLIGYIKGQGQHMSGVKAALNMLIEILPLLVFAFIIAGMVQVLVPKEILSKWVGTEAGMRGIFIGSVAGAFCPGGPFVSLPIAVGLVRSGASIGTIIAFLTGWSLWAFARLPMEVAILGWKITLIRFMSTFIFAPIAGIIAQTFFSSSG